MQRASPSSSEAAAQPLLKRLSAMALLSENDRAFVRAAIGPRETWAAGRDVPMHEAACARPRVVVSGWACRQRTRLSGVRQIFDFILPGDFLLPCPRMRSVSIASTMALTRLEVADASMIDTDAVAADSTLHQALRLACVEEEARLFDQIMRLGRLSAVERVAHLLLELYDRLNQVGLAHDYRFALPLTQEMLADALGLSVVHINRTLQQLRREKMVEMRAGFVTLLQPAALAAAADHPSPATGIEGRASQSAGAVSVRNTPVSHSY